MRKLLIVFLFLGIVGGTLPAFAQDDDCPSDVVRAWLKARSDTFDALTALDAQAQTQVTLDLIIEMQTLRRTFAEIETPACAHTAALYSHLLFANVIDYWIATYAEQTSEAVLIADQNSTWMALANEAVEALSAALTSGGAFGGGAQTVPDGKILMWEDKESFTKLDGLAFVNDFDLIFARQDTDEETLATLDDPDVGTLVVSYACNEDDMQEVLPRLGAFVAGGGHLWVFYDWSWLDCNDLVREYLGFTLVEDSNWWDRKVVPEDGDAPLLPWLDGLELRGSYEYDFDVYLMTRETGDQGFVMNDEEPRLVATSYPYEGGRVSLFPMFLYGGIMSDSQIDDYDHEEASLRIMKYLSGQLMP